MLMPSIVSVHKLIFNFYAGTTLITAILGNDDRGLSPRFCRLASAKIVTYCQLQLPDGAHPCRKQISSISPQCCPRRNLKFAIPLRLSLPDACPRTSPNDSTMP